MFLDFLHYRTNSQKDTFIVLACPSCFISQANDGVFSYNAALLAFKTYAIGQTVVVFNGPQLTM